VIVRRLTATLRPLFDDLPLRSGLVIVL